jgi:[protein-PII] uridylyltransferase
MQHDLFHVYTVDQHILMVVRNLRRFMQAEHAHEYPLCSQLIVNFDKPWLLVVAALFHDIAKGRGGDHSVLGERDADRFCRQHGILGEDRALVRFLVRHHLSMSVTGQKKDLTDPDVIRAFADLVGSERRLMALYLLTVADIRGTSAKVWNAWKGKLLEDLYRATLACLAGNNMKPLARMDTRRTEATRLLLLSGIQSDQYKFFWDSLDIGYFLRHEPSDIAWHARVLHRLRSPTAPVVKTRISPIGEGFEVLSTRSTGRACSPGSAATSTARISRSSKPACTPRAPGHALDTFMVVDPDLYLPIGICSRWWKWNCRSACRAASRSPRSSRRRLPAVATLPRIPAATEGGSASGRVGQALPPLGDIYRPHRPALRPRAHPGSERHRHLRARVATLGERAEDIFTVDGERLGSEKARLRLERELLAVL